MKTTEILKRMWSYILLVMWLFPQWSMAEDVHKLIIKKGDGIEVSVLLSEEPTIKFPHQGNYVFNLMEIVTTNQKIECSTYDLEKMSISVENLAVRIINIADGKNVSFKMQKDVLMVEVDSGKVDIAVYAIDGKTFLSKSLEVGKHILPLSVLPKGACMIKINDETIKIWNK